MYRLKIFWFYHGPKITDRITQFQKINKRKLFFSIKRFIVIYYQPNHLPPRYVSKLYYETHEKQNETVPGHPEI